MRKFKTSKVLILLVFIFSSFTNKGFAQDSYQEYESKLKELVNQNDTQELINLGKSAGGFDINLVKSGKFKSGDPAIFVAANMSGNLPKTSESALWLIKAITHPEFNFPERVNWYILPVGNPDAYAQSFSNSYEVTTNLSSVNNDKDDQSNEDGVEDMNNDGIISRMLVKHPLGSYVKDTTDQRLVRKADISKGEKGLYKLLWEGIDNDKDGNYNEDGPGGVNINRNFTYDFIDFVPENGKWNASEPASRAIIKFFNEQPEIIMSIVLGEQNSLLFPPEEGKGENSDKIKVPSYYASRLGLDEKKTYSPEELKKALSMSIEEKSRVNYYYKALLNQKAPKTVLKEDIDLYKQLSKAYKKHLKEQKYPTKVHKRGQWESGSFEKFSYFQMGIPVINLSVWQLPESQKDKTDKKDDELSYEKSLLAFADSNEIKLFKDWEIIEHPDFDEVEVGGFLPYKSYCPVKDSLEIMLEKQLGFLPKIADMLPHLSLDAKVEKKGKNIYRIDLFITNEGQISYPIGIGERNDKPAPNVLLLNGSAEILEGKQRTAVGQIKANETVKKSFLIMSKANKLNFEISTQNCSSNTLNIELP